MGGVVLHGGKKIATLCATREDRPVRMTSWDTPTYAPPHDGWCSLSTSPVCVVPNASRCGPLGELCPDMVLVQIGIDMMTVVSFVCFLVCCVRAACRVRTETRRVTATLREPVLRQDSAADVEAAEGAAAAAAGKVLCRESASTLD